MRNGHFRQTEQWEKRCYIQQASQLYLLATPRILVCITHLSNNNVSSHDTSSIIVMNYLSPVLPNFSCLVTILEFNLEGITTSLIDHHISHSALHMILECLLTKYLLTWRCKENRAKYCETCLKFTTQHQSFLWSSLFTTPGIFMMAIKMSHLVPSVCPLQWRILQHTKSIRCPTC